MLSKNWLRIVEFGKPLPPPYIMPIYTRETYLFPTTIPLSSQILSTGNHLVPSQRSNMPTRHQTSQPSAPTFRLKISPQTSAPNSAKRLLMPACKASFRDYPLREPLTTTCALAALESQVAVYDQDTAWIRADLFKAFSKEVPA